MHCNKLEVQFSVGLPSKFLSQPNNHPLLAMVTKDPIDISSSESDSDLREIDNYRDESPERDSATSDSFRILPAWASPTQSNLSGRNGFSNGTPSKRPAVRDDTLSRPPKRPNIAETASTSRANGSYYPKNDSLNTNRLVSNELRLQHLSAKRTLPASMQPSTSSARSNNLVENVSRSDFRETYARALPSALWSNSSNGKNIMKENSIRGNVSDLSYDGRGSRILPPSLMPGKISSSSAFVGSNDPFLLNGLAEERPAGPDERLVLQAAMQDLHQPKFEVNVPDGLLSVSLLKHQKIALAWMINRESSGLCLGGVLADDQGLGKTVSTIALIQMQKFLESRSKRKSSSNIRTEALNLDDDDGRSTVVTLDDTDNNKESEDFKVEKFCSRRPMAGTLIVCPASVLRQWAAELDDKVTGKLSVLVYHGGNRTKNPKILARHHVVLTTYAIVSNEVPKQPLIEEDDGEQKDGGQYGLSSAFSAEKKQKKSLPSNKKKAKKEVGMAGFDNNCGTLAMVKWERVVLDESQTIKNHRTRVARACCSLRARRRWCLSGTPIQNSIDELFSYFRFLRFDPYDKYSYFGSSIKSLISRDTVKGYQKLQVILRNIMLRRTKGTLIGGQPIINLPPKKISLTRVEFSKEEREFYDKLEQDSKNQFKIFAAAGTVKQNYANILLMLLRLRQACDHPLLVKGLGSDPVGKLSSQVADTLPLELVVNLLKKLESSSAMCLACKDPPENAVVTMCGHVFCYQCVSDYLTGDDTTCPAEDCKEQLGPDVVYSRPTLLKCASDDVDTDTDFSHALDEESKLLRSDYVSSKIKHALEILKSHCVLSSSSEDRQREKAIVFSQWTSMLDLMEASMRKSHVNYRRLDGTMSIPARDKAVKEFNSDPEVDVMLMSLKAGNLGLNMVAACRVILLDLWWNPTTEDQAVDRAHRIGQTRPVTVSRLTVKDTVEDRILTLQEDKRKLVASAFGEDQSGGHATRLTFDDLRFLFGG